MIDKVKPQALNSDVDSRNRPSNQMIDALNIAFEESFKDGVQTLTDPGGGDFSGDYGAIKPMPANRSIEDILDIADIANDSSEIRVIGSVTDDIYNIIFFFVWSDLPEQMGVWAWDRDAILPGNEIPESYIKVFTSVKFNFPSDGFVKGDVVHVGQSDIRIETARSSFNNRSNQARIVTDDPNISTDDDNDDDDLIGNPEGYINPDDRLDRVRNILLYFTDNRNEPKKLDVFKVMFYSQQIEEDYNNDDILDLICACPRTPETPISFFFDFDQDRLTSNFTNLPGIQFAYQFVYNDGVESAISTYSKLAVPPAYILLGAASGSPYLQNRCRLIIPRGTREVTSIRLLVKYGNAGSFKLIDVIKPGSGVGFIDGLNSFFDPNANLDYPFYNDRVLVPVSDEKKNMQYSNLPRVAQAQTVVSDRLLYGNYLENYPAHEVNATATPIYNKTPQGGYHLELTVKPFIVAPKNWEEPGPVSSVGNSRIAGYEINMGGVPDVLGQGSVISVEWTTVPDDHFHVYNHHKSFHGGSERYFHNYDGGYSPASDQVNTDSLNPDNSVDTAHHVDMMSGRTMFGKNKGLHFLDDAGGEENYNTWRCSVPVPDADPGTYENQTIRCAYGTSAANPLIFKAEPLFFKVSFQTNWDIENNAAYYIRDAIYNLLSGGDVPMPMQNGVELASIIDLDHLPTYSINLGLSGNIDDVDTVGGDAGQERLDMICAVKSLEAEEGAVMDQSPIGYFIINKAAVNFGLRAYPDVDNYSEGGVSPLSCYFGLDLKSLTNLDIRTCIPYIPWDQGGYNIGVPNGNYIPGENDHASWGNLYFEQNDVFSGGNNHVKGWMPPQIVNCTIITWKTFSKDYMLSTEATTIAGYAPWENFITDAGEGNGPSNQTKTSAVGHKNLLYLRPNKINEFLTPFQDGDTEGGVSYSPQGLNSNDMGSAFFPVMDESPGRFYTIGRLAPPTGGSLDIKLLHTSSETALHYDNYNKVFTIVDGEGNLGGVYDYSENFSWPSNLHEVDTYYNSGYGSDGISTGAPVYYDYPPLTDGNYSPPNRRFGSVTPYQVFKGHILPQPAINLWWAAAGAVDFAASATFYRRAALRHLRIPLSTTQPNLDPGGFSEMYDFYPAPHMLASENYLLDGNSMTSNNAEALVYIPTSVGPGYGNSGEYTNNRGNWVEVNTQYSIVALTGGEYHPRSFKTKANHEFGIIYYDQRGRSGHANFLAKTYVKGYSDLERGPYNKGRVDIKIDINSYPPRWATHYQLVYGGNSTVREFIQYTTGLAFIENTDPNFDESVDAIQEAIMYVSLGYLQGENDMSYSHSFGAMHKSGSKDLYTYSEGDKLRILRYTDNDGQTIVYPDSTNYEFEIVGVKTITSNLEDNILVNLVEDSDELDTFVPMQKSGQFLMVKSNPLATNFTYADVAQDMPMEAEDYYAGNNYWNNNCIVEIFKPKSQQDYDERLYYEIGEKYDIVLNPEGIKIHGTPSIILEDGDVWWRAVPLNEPKYATFGAGAVDVFESLIKGSTVMGGNKSEPRFRNYHLESDTFTDIIPDCAGKDWGKAKVIVSDAKTLPNEYGSINYILNDYDSVFVLQEDKASTLPVSRSILSTAGGQDQLMASEKVLGSQKFYIGEYGTDGNPESVARAEENIYWASKSKREVYKWSRKKGIEVISKAGMKAYFNNVFKRAIEDENMGEGRVRVVGGYDPLRDEFIISIHNMRSFVEDERFYDFDMDGEYITIDPDIDVDPDIDDPVIDFGCVEFYFSRQQSANPATLLPGDSITFIITISNTSDQVGSFDTIDYLPLPPHVISVTGVEDILGVPILQGESVSITIEMQIPNNYGIGTYPYSPIFTYSSEADECEDVTTYQYNLPVSVRKPDEDPRVPGDPDSDVLGDGKTELASINLPYIYAFDSSGNGDPNGGDGGNGDPNGGNGGDDPVEGYDIQIPWNWADLDANDDGDIGSADLLQFLGDFGFSTEYAGRSIFDINNDGSITTADLLIFLDAFDTDVSDLSDTRPEINWCEYDWVDSNGNVTVLSVTAYFAQVEADGLNIWDILPIEVYNYLAQTTTPNFASFTHLYFIQSAETGGNDIYTVEAYECSDLSGGNGNSLVYDVNNDGVVNMLDVFTLEQFIDTISFYPAISNFDYDGDGDVDADDVNILQQSFMPSYMAPFNICEFIDPIDGIVGAGDMLVLFISSEYGGANDPHGINQAFFDIFVGMSSEEIGCNNPEVIPQAPFNICEFLVNEYIDTQAHLLFQDSEYNINDPSGLNLAYFEAHWGLNAEQIGCPINPPQS